jgi:hypothetical protein
MPRRYRLTRVCGKSRDTCSKRVLDALGVGRQQSVLFAQATVRPYRSDITRAEFVELPDESIAELR